MNNCIICKNSISDDDLMYEDYYTVFRGNNAIFYSGASKAMTGLICFSCIEDLKVKYPQSLEVQNV